MKTIYNAQGESKELDACDAREHIATGRWFADAPAADAPVKAEQVWHPDGGLTDAPAADAPAAGNGGTDTSRMNKAALLAHLTALGVEHSETMTKAELIALLK